MFVFFFSIAAAAWRNLSCAVLSCQFFSSFSIFLHIFVCCFKCVSAMGETRKSTKRSDTKHCPIHLQLSLAQCESLQHFSISTWNDVFFNFILTVNYSCLFSGLFDRTISRAHITLKKRTNQNQQVVCAKRKKSFCLSCRWFCYSNHARKRCRNDQSHFAPCWSKGVTVDCSEWMMCSCRDKIIN